MCFNNDNDKKKCENPPSDPTDGFVCLPIIHKCFIPLLMYNTNSQFIQYILKSLFYRLDTISMNLLICYGNKMKNIRYPNVGNSSEI